jgi:hypothetical protein
MNKNRDEKWEQVSAGVLGFNDIIDACTYAGSENIE